VGSHGRHPSLSRDPAHAARPWAPWQGRLGCMVAARRCCTGGAGRCCRVDGGRRRGESGKVQPWRRGELRTAAPGAAAATTEATSGGARSCNRSDLELQPWRRPGAMTPMMLEPTSFFAGTGDRRCYNRGSKMLEPTATAFSRFLFFCVYQPLFLLEPLSIFAGTSDFHACEYKSIFFSFLPGLQILVQPVRKFASTTHLFC
uniref:Uncharacterized protein n=2 Tax=Aegilops tauschii subsp. strangulata TaxID=200361 RepID=A0A453SS84_AEGTS